MDKMPFLEHILHYTPDMNEKNRESGLPNLKPIIDSDAGREIGLAGFAITNTTLPDKRPSDTYRYFMTGNTNHFRLKKPIKLKRSFGMKKLFVLVSVVLMLGFISNAWSAVAEYGFNQSTAAYTPITGGTIIAEAIVGGAGVTSLDNNHYNVDLPFVYYFNGFRFTTVTASTDGILVFNNRATFSSSAAISSNSAADGVIAANSQDLQGLVTNAANLGQMRYETLGTAPNRSVVFQWSKFRHYNINGENYNFQIILTETSNVATIHYGPHTVTYTGTVQVGLRGTSNADYLNRTTTTDWSATTAGASNAATCTWSPTVRPASGLKFTYTPPAVTAVPSAAVIGSPADAAINVVYGTPLVWSNGGGWTTGFKLYFGTNNPPTNIVNGTDLGYVTTYTPAFTASTTHYWKVVPYNSVGNNTAGTVWYYTTAATPLTGIKTIDPAGSGANNYTTFTAAINALNTLGVGTAGVTYNVARGAVFTEKLPAITVNATASNPVIFQAAGSGAVPYIQAGVGIGTSDAIVTFSGCDYVTWDGINVQENAANLTTTTQAEYGFYVTNNSTVDGARYNTIKNCNVTMEAANTGSTGIFLTISYNAINALGASAYNKYYNLNVNARIGYYVYGNSTVGLEGVGNEIGTTGGGTASITGCVYGVYGTSQKLFKVYNQAITLAGGAFASIEYGIYHSGSTGTVEYYNNTITVATPVTGAFNIYGINTSSVATASIHGNSISGLSSTYSTGGNYIYGIYQGAGITISIYNNDIYSLSGNQQIVYGMTLNNYGTDTVYGNNIYSLTANNTVYGMYTSMMGGNIYDNTIHDLTNSAGQLYGVYNSTGSNSFYGNQIYNLAASGYYAYGYYLSSGSTMSIYSNKIYNVAYTGSSTYATSGMYINGGTTNNVYNNMIYDLKAPAAGNAATIRSVSGMYIGGGTTNNVYNNSIYLNATGNYTSWSSAALYVSGGITIDLKNNIFVNDCTPGATGRVVAFWKSITGFTNLSAASDKNIYYAGTAGTTNLLFYNGTNACQTLAAYKTLNVGKDQGAYAENVPFLSTTAPYNLHINPAVATHIEGNGLVIATVTNDFDGDARSGSMPDIGADEGGFTVLDVHAGIDTPVNGITINSTIELSIDLAVTNTDPILLALPTYEPVGSTVMAFNGAGMGDLTVFVPAGTWHLGLYDGAWHWSVPDPIVGAGTYTFTGINYGAKADVIVLLSPVESTLPVELSSFTAVLTAEAYVNLTWVTESETDALGFNVYRSVTADIADAVRTNSNVISATNTSVQHTYSVIDEEVEANATYYYWLESTELNNNSTFHGPNSVTIGSGGEIVPPPTVITRTGISKAYPNPFNPRTQIDYNLKDQTQVTLTVFNHKGQLIRTLVNTTKASGNYRVAWDGNDSNGISCASGVYYVRMQTKGSSSACKIVLLK